MEDDALAAHRAQLCGGARMIAGFADGHAVEIGDLVGADDDRLGVEPGDRVGLGEGQPEREVARRLAGMRCFVHIGRAHLERQAQALQQLLAVSRCRGEHQAPDRHAVA
jgi:hypothetical protein